MTKLSKKIFFLLSIAILANSCKKDLYDPALEKYFGSWKFTETEYYWSYNYDDEGNSYETTTETILWESIGDVSMGPKMGQIRIDWKGKGQPTYIANVAKGLGHLSCTSGCENIPNRGDFTSSYGCHHITEIDYCLQLGSQDLFSIQRSWSIKGIKL